MSWFLAQAGPGLGFGGEALQIILGSQPSGQDHLQVSARQGPQAVGQCPLIE
jgi:hypothetical protein